MQTRFRFILCLPLLLSFASRGHSQVIYKDINNAAVKALMAGKLYVVLTDDDTFNHWFQKAVENVWSVTGVQFITSAELDTLATSDKNVFLFSQSREDRGGMHLTTTADMVKKKLQIFIIEQGGVRQSKYMFTTASSGPKIIGYFRYDPARSEVTLGNMEIEMLLSFMNQSLQIVIDGKIKGSVRDSIWERLYAGAANIKDKTMLFNSVYSDGTIELDKKPLISEKLIADYPFNYRYTTPDTIRQLLTSDPADYCYLFLYYPSQYVNQADDNGDILVYDPLQKKMLYYDDNYEGPWFEKGELKDMIYAIKEK